MGSITSELWLREQRGLRPRVGSPGTATSATGDLTQRGSLSPGLCRSLVKESYSPSSNFLQVIVLLGELHVAPLRGSRMLIHPLLGS